MSTDFVIERGKREIMADVRNGTIPSTAADFSELHNYVDANGYGGAFEDDAHAVEDVDFWNAVQDALDLWIKSGALREA